MIEFQAFPKIPRQRRDIVITEKIDGTNACVQIARIDDNTPRDEEYLSTVKFVEFEGEEYDVAAQSRKRIITPGNDNYAFADWVWKNADELVSVLGEGKHFGEWWGQGIQRRYDSTWKTFSLFNSGRWSKDDFAQTEIGKRDELDVVPVLYHGTFSDEAIEHTLQILREQGSWASPGFMNPEGVVIFHTQSRQMYKVLLENDELPKSLL